MPLQAPAETARQPADHRMSETRSEPTLKLIGDWLKRHQGAIGAAQWTVVAVYLFLIIVPAVLPIPDSRAHLWDNLVLFAQFVFWGIWWPFVLISMMLVGRVWCGLLCPEGALSETVSRKGRGLSVPRWVTWKGWPFVAFVCTTVYGQMVSVYQYAAPTLIILGGSTLAAIATGYFWGRNKRVWCRYLCPVSGVFALLSKVAPLHFQVDPQAWLNHPRVPGQKPEKIVCAPLVPIRTMDSASQCHMCGRCSDYRGAIALTWRSPNHEIVHVAGRHTAPWETLLILFGLMGVAAGAFHWSVSPWYIAIKQALATFAVDHGGVVLLHPLLPWWILTNYPDQNDVLTLLDGALLLGYIAATALAVGIGSTAALALATRALGPWRGARFHHLAQALIPIAACGVFLGLSALTVTLLRQDGVTLPFVNAVRVALLGGAGLWSLILVWKISRLYSRNLVRRAAAVLASSGALALGIASWALLFLVW